MIDKQFREDRRRAQREGVEALEASGALDDLYARIDAGEVRFDGRDGLIQQLIKAGLERGLQAELSEHLGYDKGDPDSAAFPNSRNGSSAKTVATSVGDVDLAIPGDRDGTFTPMLVPKGSRRVGGFGLCQVSWTGVLLVRPRLRSEVGGQRRGPRLGFGSRGWSGGGVGCRTPRCTA